MACCVRRLLGVLMKAPKTPPDAVSGTSSDQSGPQPERVTWHKAVPPKMAGWRDGVDGDPLRAKQEWRPGEASRRGYEKAVEDWWWL